MVELLLTICAAVIPVLWGYFTKKLNIAVQDNDMLLKVVVSCQGEIEEIYKLVKEQIGDKIKDGKIDKEELKDIIGKAIRQSHESKFKLIKELSPIAYQYFLKIMLEKALKG